MLRLRPLRPAHAGTAIEPVQVPAHAADKARPSPPSGSPLPDIVTPSAEQATASPSTGTPDVSDSRSHSASPVTTSPPCNPSSSASSLGSKPETSSTASASGAMEPSSTAVDVEPDPQILEALKSKDRLYVLKLGEQMEAVIKEGRWVFAASLSCPSLASHDDALHCPHHSAPALTAAVTLIVPCSRSGPEQGSDHASLPEHESSSPRRRLTTGCSSIDVPTTTSWSRRRTPSRMSSMFTTAQKVACKSYMS